MRMPLEQSCLLICAAHEAFIGSENFSYSSLSENREVGVILHRAAEIRQLQAQFMHDWSHSRGLP